MILRLLLVIFASGLFGAALGFLSRSKDSTRNFVYSGIAAFAGLLAAILLQASYPVLFDHLLSRQSWFEWTEFLTAPEYLPIFLSRSLILLPLGFACGYGLSSMLVKSGAGTRSCLPVAAFLAGFALIWATQAEHLPSGCSSRVYVYRISGSQSDDDGMEFAEFLDWNSSPHMGYEIYSRGFSLDFLDGKLKLEIGKSGPPVYVFVKEYWLNGKRQSLIKSSLVGKQSASELGSYFRNFARSRCSPGQAGL